MREKKELAWVLGSDINGARTNAKKKTAMTSSMHHEEKTHTKSAKQSWKSESHFRIARSSYCTCDVDAAPESLFPSHTHKYILSARIDADMPALPKPEGPQSSVRCNK